MNDKALAAYLNLSAAASKRKDPFVGGLHVESIFEREELLRWNEVCRLLARDPGRLVKEPDRDTLSRCCTEGRVGIGQPHVVLNNNEGGQVRGLRQCPPRRDGEIGLDWIGLD